MVQDSRVQYDPTSQYEVKSFDIDYWRDGETALPATMYQPEGAGPFPALLRIHGGQWSRGSRLTDEPIDMALATSGLVVMAIDFRLAPDHPYPTQIADANFAIRWLKAHASEFNAVPDCLGGVGGSSGGHTIVLSAMRPHDPRYASIPLPEAPDTDASLAYVLSLWAVLDPLSRYSYAKEVGRDDIVASTEGYFLTDEAMREANPQMVLERKEPVELRPTLIIQGLADDNIPRHVPERFIESFRAAGGELEVEWFPGMHHAFAREPLPESDRAHDAMRSFIARQLARCNENPTE